MLSGNENFSLLGFSDLNARTGKELDYIIDDNVEWISGLEWYTASDFSRRKKSKDNHVNIFGRTLLNLCEELDVHIVNGRCGYNCVKESFSFKTRMPGTVKCRPTVAYWVQIDGINIATELITRYYSTRHWSNAVLMLGQRLRRWPNIEPTLDKCTMFERKSSCPANASHLYDIYAMSAQRLRRWSNIA